MRPDFVPESDWRLILERARGNLDVAHFIAAIGWHETRWGTVGAGRRGFHLGYGVFDTPNPRVEARTRGLQNQIDGVIFELSKFFGNRDIQTWRIDRATINRFHDVEWRSTAGGGAWWRDGVGRIYESLRGRANINIAPFDINRYRPRLPTPDQRQVPVRRVTATKIPTGLISTIILFLALALGIYAFSRRQTHAATRLRR